jgi:hypothetical protein
MTEKQATDKTSKLVVIRMSDLKPIATTAPGAPTPAAPVSPPIADETTTSARAAAGTLGIHE